MSYNREKCEQCGKEFYASTQAPIAMYCSDACRMRAYRARKKKLKEAKERTLTFEQSRAQSDLIKHGDRPVRDQLDKFAKKHGMVAYKDLLDVVDVFLNECSKNS